MRSNCTHLLRLLPCPMYLLISCSCLLAPDFWFPSPAVRTMHQPSQLPSCFFGLWVSIGAIDSAGSLGLGILYCRSRSPAIGESQHAPSWTNLWPPRVGVRRDTSAESFSHLFYLTVLYSSFRILFRCHPLGAFSDP